jgi:hypothetical protein
MGYLQVMAVDDPGIVDIVSESESGAVVLTISDHLDWHDTISHQRTLQEKLNRYLSFVESGEILKHRPSAAVKPVIIRVVCQHEPDALGRGFLQRARSMIEKAGFGFQYQFFGYPK